ncbi:hypothetical protein L1987_18621 [Smallanthus sonchifolius]|uniref:Uncharacterized protein n=1 Tax=Smallanthus sonchifolius TaxID=185202 RepID=A0ACB9J2F3_9ASTR|nr:hypothetical protein L1987_18621 [Smallanthus sonchifolius]
MIHMRLRPGKSGIRATGRRNRVFTGGNSRADKGECSTHRNGRRVDFRRESSGQRRGQRFRRDREMVTQRRGLDSPTYDWIPGTEAVDGHAWNRGAAFGNGGLGREVGAAFGNGGLGHTCLIKRMFNNLVEYVEHQEQKTDSELEGNYLEKYYTCVAESSNQKQGSLNDQDVERIGHESGMLWNEFEKEHQDFCTKERATTPESEPEENYTYYDDHAILDARMGETDLVGTAAVNETQTAGSFNNLEVTGSKDGEDLFESLDDQSEESSIVSNCEVPRRKMLSKFDDEPEGKALQEKAESISSDEDFIIILNKDVANI